MTFVRMPAAWRGAPRALGLIVVLVLALPLARDAARAHWEGRLPDPARTPEALYAMRLPNLYHHNVGLLELMVTNVGVVGNMFVRGIYGAGWRGGEYLFAGSMWIGAVAPDNLAYVSTGAGYTAEGVEMELLPPLDPRYTIYESYEGMSGGDRPGFSPSRGDDDGDGAIDEDFHNGFDDDQDGAIDEDYEAISQQMFSCEYWDNLPEARSFSPDHRALNLHIRQRSFAWSSPGANEFVGLDYSIINEGWETLRQVYLGYFVDSDAGNKSISDFYVDDGGGLARIDTVYVNHAIDYTCEDRKSGRLRACGEQNLHLDVAYMHDTPGDQTGGRAADDLPPGQQGYFGGMFLGHTTDPFGVSAPERVGIHTLAFFSGSGVYPDGDPANDYQRYDLLQRGTVPTRPTGQPSDYRYCFSAGPFRELLPGDELKFQVAFVIGDGLEGMVSNAIMAQRVYDGQWCDVDNNPETGCNGRETCLHIEEGGDPLFWDDPADSLGPPIGPIKNTGCELPEYWYDVDWNCCTPLQKDPARCLGLETLVHWVGTVAPPPPQKNTDDAAMRREGGRLIGDQQVCLLWDNTSELVADPLLGEINFKGYRIWRVEGWTRPIGSIGPAPEEWQQVAVLTRDPVGTEMDLDDFTDAAVAPSDSVPDPEHPGRFLAHYPIGRYFFVDDEGLKNGMLYFYDVTSYSQWSDDEGEHYLSGMPAARERDGVVPEWAHADAESWQDRVIVVPNPWNGSAGWDLVPSDADPTGTKIAFARLPDRDCRVRIYTLAGDLVRELSSEGRGTVFWNLITRNGQDVASGVYLYAVQCGDENTVGRFTIIR